MNDLKRAHSYSRNSAHQPASKKRRISSNWQGGYSLTSLGNLFSSRMQLENGYAVPVITSNGLGSQISGEKQHNTRPLSALLQPGGGLPRSTSTSSLASTSQKRPIVTGLGQSNSMFSYQRKQKSVNDEQSRLRSEAALAPGVDEEYQQLTSQGLYKDTNEAYRSFVSYGRTVQALLSQSSPKHKQSRSSSVLDGLQKLHVGKSSAFQAVVQNAKLSTASKPPPLSTPRLTAAERLQRKQADLDKDLDNRLIRRRKFRNQLAPDQQAQATAFMKDPKFLSKIPGAEATARDVQFLKPGKWLNDEIINFYVVLINERSKAAEELRASNEKENIAVKENANGKKKKKIKAGEEILKVHCFNSFFYSKLSKSGYDSVRRWTKKIDVFACDAVLLPINVGNSHWVSACINIRQKRFEFYDSMGNFNQSIIKILRDYIEKEHLDKKKKPLDTSDWIEFEHSAVPRQLNGFDCGVFTCQMLECLARKDAALDFSQENMPYLRQKMVYEIGTRQFLNEEWET